MTTERPPTIDAAAAAHWLQRPRTASAWLHEEVARRMQERLDWIRLQPASWLDWEPVLGGLQAHAALAARYPGAAAFVGGHDAARAWAAVVPPRPWWQPSRWRRSSPAAPLPPAAGVDMLWANMTLHMEADPQALIAHWQRRLAVGGFLMFSCFGPDTLRELRALYAALDWPPPAHDFTDMHDWGDMLVQAGFTDPVLDMERIVLTFPSAERLLQELRGLGRNLHPARFPSLRGRAWQARLRAALAQLARPGGDGALALTFEVIYGHALKAAPRIAMGEQTVVPLDDLRQVLRGGKPSAAGGLKGLT